MADEKTKKAPEAAAAPPTQPLAPPSVEAERDALLKAILDKERENKSLEGQLASASPEVLAELGAFNKELKANLLKVEKDLALELMNRKNPLDATGISDKLQVFKMEVLAYCADRQLDPALWKKLESL